MASENWKVMVPATPTEKSPSSQTTFISVADNLFFLKHLETLHNHIKEIVKHTNFNTQRWREFMFELEVRVDLIAGRVVNVKMSNPSEVEVQHNLIEPLLEKVSHEATVMRKISSSREFKTLFTLQHPVHNKKSRGPKPCVDYLTRGKIRGKYVSIYPIEAKKVYIYPRYQITSLAFQYTQRVHFLGY